MSGDPPARPPRLALLVRDLGSGGTQRSQIGLAGALANAGWPVDLVVCSARITGSGIAPPKVRVVNLRPGARPFARLAPFLADPSGAAQLASVLLTRLRPSPTLSYLPALVRYLRRERPAGVIAASTSLNLEAIWARRLARSGTALVVSERSHRTLADREASARERRLLGMAGRYYPEADAIVAVSTAVADQLARRDGLARQAISVIHDLVAVQEVAAMAQEPAEPSLVRARRAAGDPGCRPADRAEGLPDADPRLRRSCARGARPVWSSWAAAATRSAAAGASPS